MAAVFDMENDLHAFVKKEHRGHGDLIRAMDSAILPRLFQKERKVQKLTFQEEKVAEHFEKRLGFKRTGPLSAEKELSSYANRPPLKLGGLALSRDDIQAMELNIARATLYWKMARERLETAVPDWEEPLP